MGRGSDLQIAERATALALKNGIVTTTKLNEWRTRMVMDLTATHANGMPLRLDDLLAFPDGDFGHDVVGITVNIDRNTGTLQNCFVPRCAAPTPIEEQRLGELAERED